jgi:hypothetical protein
MKRTSLKVNGFGNGPLPQLLDSAKLYVLEFTVRSIPSELVGARAGSALSYYNDASAVGLLAAITEN